GIASAEGAYPYYYELTDAPVTRDFDVICSHFKRVDVTAGTATRVPGTMISDIKNDGVPSIWYFVPYSTRNEFLEYIEGQKSAGTPIEVVYELAEPDTEPSESVLPIVPEKGEIDISTDADSLTAELTCSGWETVNDTSD